MADTCEVGGEERANVEAAELGPWPAGSAVRVRRAGRVLYLMPYREDGRRVLFEQDAETFATTRRTVDAGRARTLRAAGIQVPLALTPAWCDPAAPRTDSERARLA